jgi:hypothetical protein
MAMSMIIGTESITKNIGIEIMNGKCGEDQPDARPLCLW